MKLWFWPYTQGCFYLGMRRKKKKKIEERFVLDIALLLPQKHLLWLDLFDKSIHLHCKQAPLKQIFISIYL